jgi:uncharacterized phage-associated protein
MENAKYSAADIADWFIHRSHQDLDDGYGEGMSVLKLQKLLYYSNGASMALFDRPMFKEDMLAWRHGPVVKCIYDKYTGQLNIPKVAKPNIDKESESILEEIYKVFGQFSAWKLVDMTHDEEPWKKTKQGEVIDPQLVKAFFAKTYIANN